MHINPSHRHWVIAPLFAAVLGCSALPVWSSSLSGSVAISIAAASDTPFALSDGMNGIAYYGAQLETQHNDVPLLRDGSVLLRSNGVLQLQAGAATIMGFRGAMHVMADAQSLTVTTLTTPVVVRFGDAVTVLPPGKQRTWSMDHATVFALDQSLQDSTSAIDVPLSLIAEYLRALESVEMPAPDAVQADTQQVIHVSKTDDAVDQAFRTLQQAVASNDPAAVTEVIAASKDLLVTDPMRLSGLLQDLLRTDDARQSIVASILPLLPSDPLMLLARLHPALRDAAWVQGFAGASDDLIALSILAFPLADQLPHAGSELALARWEIEAQEWIAQDDRRLQQLLAWSEPARKAFEQRGYPERIEHYGTALRHIAAAVSDAGEQTALSPWFTQTPVALEEPVAQEVSQSSQAQSSRPAVDPATAEHVARVALEAAGAVFSTATALKPMDDGTVTVRGILFGATDGMHSYDLQIDTVTKQVQNISKDGAAPMPFEMSFEAFATWARGE